MEDDNEIKEAEITPLDDEQVDTLRDVFFGLANDLKKDVPLALEKAEEYNTVEPITNLFNSIFGLLASLVATINVIDTESRIKLYNCEGCLKRKECKTYLNYLSQKEDNKQGHLFKIPVIYSDKTH